MKCEFRSYEIARPFMKPGDVIAFGGKGHFSEIIKMATFSPVSHVGTILQTKIVPEYGDGDSRFFNQIIESTSLDGFNGVNISRFSDRLNTYDGDIWWLPLKESVRSRMSEKKFYNYLFNLAKNRVPYDMPQAIKSALDLFDGLPFSMTSNKEDFSKMFCSELVASGLEESGAINSVNCSEVTPIDLCRWNIYEDICYQIKGENLKPGGVVTLPEGVSISEYNNLLKYSTADDLYMVDSRFNEHNDYGTPKVPKPISRFNTCNPSDWNV